MQVHYSFQQTLWNAVFLKGT